MFRLTAINNLLYNIFQGKKASGIYTAFSTGPSIFGNVHLLADLLRKIIRAALSFRYFIGVRIIIIVQF